MQIYGSCIPNKALYPKLCSEKKSSITSATQFLSIFFANRQPRLSSSLYIYRRSISNKAVYLRPFKKKASTPYLLLNSPYSLYAIFEANELPWTRQASLCFLFLCTLHNLSAIQFPSSNIVPFGIISYAPVVKPQAYQHIYLSSTPTIHLSD